MLPSRSFSSSNSGQLVYQAVNAVEYLIDYCMVLTVRQFPFEKSRVELYTSQVIFYVVPLLAGHDRISVPKRVAPVHNEQRKPVPLALLLQGFELYMNRNAVVL